MDPVLVDLQLAQGVSQFVGVTAWDEIGRRTLQQRDVLDVGGDGRDQGRGRGARADDDDLLAFVVQVLGPGLRVDDQTLIGLHPRPLGRVAFRMPEIALAHPEEVGGEGRGFTGVGPHRLQSPQIVLAGPARRGDLGLVLNVTGQIMVVDDLAHIGQDLFGRGDGRALPRLEAVAEGVEVAVGSDARIAVGMPGAAEALLALQHREARPRTLLN